MSKDYFLGLNYSLANEDTRIEYGLLPLNCEGVFSIAGSGARCLPLIAKNPASLHIVDLSEEQLYLCELRLEAVKCMSYEEWLYFMGYRQSIQSAEILNVDREQLFKRIHLSDPAKQYWSDRLLGWKSFGFIYLGRWEKHFQKLGLLFRNYLKCNFLPIFLATSIQEQQHAYEKYWPHWRWNAFIKIVASEFVFNKFLYNGHFSGVSQKKTEQRSAADFISQEFYRVFQTQLVRTNYFFQSLFLGNIFFEEGLPLEAHRSVFESVQKSTTQVTYRQAALQDVLMDNPYGFISLSDTLSYVDPAVSHKILNLINPKTPSGSKVIIRSFMKKPIDIDSKGWSLSYAESDFSKQQDGTAVYEFQIFNKQ